MPLNHGNGVVTDAIKYDQTNKENLNISKNESVQVKVSFTLTLALFSVSELGLPLAWSTEVFIFASTS